MSLTVSPSWPLEPYDTYQQHLPTETKASFGSKRAKPWAADSPQGNPCAHHIPPAQGEKGLPPPWPVWRFQGGRTDRAPYTSLHQMKIFYSLGPKLNKKS
jgi:hypothetical protein